MVLVWKKAYKGKHKIKDMWENSPYKVIHQVRPGMPVYKVCAEGGSAKICILHRNMVFPLILGFEGESGIESSGDLVGDPLIGKENIGDSSDELENSGPITRSRSKMQTCSKSLLKADALTDEQDIQATWDGSWFPTLCMLFIL